MSCEENEISCLKNKIIEYEVLIEKMNNINLRYLKELAEQVNNHKIVNIQLEHENKCLRNELESIPKTDEESLYLISMLRNQLKMARLENARLKDEKFEKKEELSGSNKEDSEV